MHSTSIPARHVLAVTAWGPGASSPRVRLHEWIRRVGVSCEVRSYAGLSSSGPGQLLHHPVALIRAELGARTLDVGRHDVVFLLREASPFSRGGLEARLLTEAKFGVYDFDDALQWDLGHSHGFYRRLAPKGPKAVAAVGAADRVIAGNETLAGWASDLNRDVVVIPTCVDPGDYLQKVEYQLADPPRIGWIGSSNNEENLLAVADALLDVHQKFGARLVIVSGAHSAPLGRLESMVDRMSWSTSSQRALLATFDIGIMPLPDSPYQRGKCGYKLLQYAAAGVPAVGSPVGVNQHILAAFDMPAPATAGEWSDALFHLLVLGSEARRSMAERARQVVRADYSYDAWQDRWCQAVIGAR